MLVLLELGQSSPFLAAESELLAQLVLELVKRQLVKRLMMMLFSPALEQGCDSKEPLVFQQMMLFAVNGSTSLRT